MTANLSAKIIKNARWNYELNLPEDWSPARSFDSDQIQAFSSLDDNLLLVINVWEKKGQTVEILYREHLEILEGRGRGDAYDFQGHRALMSRIVHTVDQEERVSYVFYLIGSRFAYRVMASGPKNILPIEIDYLYSVLDSFNIDGFGMWERGPVSTFLLKHQEEDWQKVEVFIGGLGAFIEFNQGEITVSQEVFAREKRILDQVSEERFPFALTRYYEMAFRESFKSLKSLAFALERNASRSAYITPLYEDLLYNIQDNTGGAEANLKLTVPLRILTTETFVSLDSWALFYSIILSHLQYDTIICYSAGDLDQLAVGVRINNLVISDPAELGILIEDSGREYRMGELAGRIFMGWLREELAYSDKIIVRIMGYSASAFSAFFS